VPRRLLERRIETIGLAAALVPREAFRPYPRAVDRGAWERLVPEDRRRAFVAAAEKQLAEPWAVLPASRFLDYVRDGNRGRYESLLFSRREKLGLLVLGETLEGRGRFADAIADGVWLLCEESFWGVPAHVGAQKRGSGLPDVTEPTVDLFAAETGALLAWTDYLVGEGLDAVHPLVRERLRLEVDRRILTPALDRDDFWWMGFTPREVNNWNPWINSNWLAAVLLLERDPSTGSSTRIPTTAAATRARRTGAGRARRSSRRSSCCTRRRAAAWTRTASPWCARWGASSRPRTWPATGT
jgi:hypothetical protein